MPQRKTVYDIASLILLATGGGLLLVALLFAIASVALWYMSTAFARLAIAASGRQ